MKTQSKETATTNQPETKEKVMTNEANITVVTLKDACAEYLEHQKSIGKKDSTIGTAMRTLDLLIAEMGEEKEVGKILPLHIAKFFKSEAATMQKGKEAMRPRAQASILQIRRIVRAALVWWNEQSYSKSVALPKEEKRFLDGKGFFHVLARRLRRTSVGKECPPRPDRGVFGMQENRAVQRYVS